MLDLVEHLRKWKIEGRSPGLATLVAVEGASPCEVGATLCFEPINGISYGPFGIGPGERVNKAILERLPAIVAADGVEHHIFGVTGGDVMRVRLERYFGASEDPVMREIATVWEDFLQQDEPGVLVSRGTAHLLMMRDGSVLGERAAWSSELLARAYALTQSGAGSELWDPDASDPTFLRVNRPRPPSSEHLAVK